MGSKKRCLKTGIIEINWTKRRMETVNCGEEDQNGITIHCENCKFNIAKDKEKKWKRPTRW